MFLIFSNLDETFLYYKHLVKKDLVFIFWQEQLFYILLIFFKISKLYTEWPKYWAYIIFVSATKARKLFFSCYCWIMVEILADYFLRFDSKQNIWWVKWLMKYIYNFYKFIVCLIFTVSASENYYEPERRLLT